MARHLADANRGDVDGACAQVGEDFRGLLFGANLGLLPVDADQPREERRATVGLAEPHAQHPVRNRLEGRDLVLALDKPQGDGLHAARAGAALDVAPDEGADLVADDSVDQPPRLLRVDARHVDVAGIGQGGADRARRDLVVLYAAEGRSLGHVVQHFAEMPGDGLPFAVGVRGQEYFVRLLRRRAQARDDFGGCVGYDVFGLEALLRVDAEAVRRKVAYVAL